MEWLEKQAIATAPVELKKQKERLVVLS